MVFENRVNNKDCRNRWRRARYRDNTSRIKTNNFEKRLKLLGFRPVRDIYLIAIVMLIFSSLT